MTLVTRPDFDFFSFVCPLLPFDHIPFGFSNTHYLCPSVEWFSQHLQWFARNR